MTDLAYVAINPCGCVSSLARAGFVERSVMRHQLDGWVNSGRRVDLMPFAQASEQLREQCPHKLAPQTEEQIARLLDEVDHNKPPSEKPPAPPRPRPVLDAIARINLERDELAPQDKPLERAVALIVAEHPQTTGRIHDLAVAGALVAGELDRVIAESTGRHTHEWVGDRCRTCGIVVPDRLSEAA